MNDYNKLTEKEVVIYNKQFYFCFKILNEIIDCDAKNIRIKMYVDVILDTLQKLSSNPASSTIYRETVALSRVNFKVYENFIRGCLLR